jgi:hypothetical protein
MKMPAHYHKTMITHLFKFNRCLSITPFSGFPFHLSSVRCPMVTLILKTSLMTDALTSMMNVILMEVSVGCLIAMCFIETGLRFGGGLVLGIVPLGPFLVFEDLIGCLIMVLMVR